MNNDVYTSGLPNNVSGTNYSLNYPLLLLIALIPLQNIYLGKIPSLGMGINFLNVTTLLAILAWQFNKSFRVTTHSVLSRSLKFFIGIYILSLFYGVVHLGHMGEAHIEKLKDILIPLIIYFVVLNCVRDRRGMVITIAATLLPLPYMFYVFKTQFSSVFKWHYSHDYRINGTFMELGSNEFAAFFAGYTIFLIAMLLTTKNRLHQYILGILVITNGYCLLYSFSRGSWLSFLFSLAVVAFILYRKVTVIAVLLLPLTFGAILPFLPVAVQERAETIFVQDEEERDQSAASRFVLWENAFSEYMKSPIIGIGFHVFHHVNPYEGKDTHNYYIKLLTEQGVIGLIIFIGILVKILKFSKKLFDITDDKLFKGIGLGVFAMTLSFILGNMFGDRMSHYPLSTYFWVYVALAERAYIIALSEFREIKKI